MSLAISDLLTEIYEEIGDTTSSGTPDYSSIPQNLTTRKLIKAYKDVVFDSGNVTQIKDSITGIDGQDYIDTTLTPLRIINIVDEADTVYEEGTDNYVAQDTGLYRYYIYNDKVYITPQPTSSKIYEVTYIGYDSSLTTSSTSIDLPNSLKDALLYKTLEHIFQYDGQYQLSNVMAQRYKKEIMRAKTSRHSGVKRSWKPSWRA